MSLEVFFNHLFIGYFTVFLLKSMLFLLIEKIKLSVDEVRLFLCFGWDKCKIIGLSIESNCFNCTTVILVKTDRFVITIVNGIIYHWTMVRTESYINVGIII